MRDSHINFFTIEELRVGDTQQGNEVVSLNFDNITLANNTIENAENFFYVLNYDYDGYFAIEIANSNIVNNTFHKIGYFLRVLGSSYSPFTMKNTDFHNNSYALIRISPTTESKHEELIIQNC